MRMHVPKVFRWCMMWYVLHPTDGETQRVDRGLTHPVEVARSGDPEVVRPRWYPG